MKRVVSLLLSLLLLLPVLPFSVTAAGNYTYIDSANSNTFTVGADWVQENLATDPMYKVKFTHIQEHGDCISYGSHDVWSQLSTHEQQSVPRGSYDHTMYTHQEIADYLSVKERFVQTITIAGKTFFRAEEVKSSFIFFEVSTTHFVHIHNGWLYLYSFNGNRYNSHYSDFRKLLSSSIFPEADSIPPIETTPGTTPTEATPSITVPVETAPSTTVPVETTPPTTAPVETIPPTTAPVETTPPTTAPVETTPPTTAPVETTVPDDDIYKRAKAAYEREDYQEAQELFSLIPTYLDSGDYLRLLRIRNYGGNIGIGVVYDFGKALTNEQKRDIDAAAKNFDFADTARVLLWNVDVATYFLYDNWYYTENSKVYLKWHTDSGGFYYTRSNVLSTAISNTVSIHDGYLRVDINTTNKLVFHITLIDPNTMELYCYEYDKTYTMIRR